MSVQAQAGHATLPPSLTKYLQINSLGMGPLRRVILFIFFYLAKLNCYSTTCDHEELHH